VEIDSLEPAVAPENSEKQAKRRMESDATTATLATARPRGVRRTCALLLKGDGWMAIVVIILSSYYELSSRTIVESGDTLRTSVLKQKVHPATDIGKFF